MGGISVAAAIIVGLVSSFIQSFGLTLQRKSHVQTALLPLSQRRRPHRRPLWLLGFGIYMTSNIFATIFQLDALPIVILAPLGAVSLIFNALLARIVLGDIFGRRAIVGTALVAAGAVLIAVFGVVQEEEHTVEELMKLWARPAFLAFFSIVAAGTIGVLVTAHVVAWHIHRQHNAGRMALRSDTPPISSRPPSNYASPHSPPSIPFRPTSHATRRWSAPAPTSPLVQPLHIPTKSVAFQPDPDLESPLSSQPLSPLFAPNDAQQRTLTLCGLAFAAASGTLSGMSLVLAKAAVELLVITLDYVRTGRGSNQFAHVQAWLLVAGLAVGAVLQLVYLNYSLTFASPALICPLAFCFFNLSSIFDGLVFYDQIARLSPLKISLVALGVVVLLVGVWVVSAVQPTGDGGVEVGTWAEEEDDVCSSDEVEEATLLDGDRFFDEPISTPIIPSPLSPISPRSPLSPTPARSRHRHRGPRYGTLIPELAPAGFSIGLGAASPGFALRSGSISLTRDREGLERRARSRSEGQRGIEAIMHGEAGVGLGIGVGASPRSEGQEVEHGAEGGEGEENGTEGELRRWADDQREKERRKGLWGWWKRKDRRIKLDDQGEDQS
ncbi:hypothetical protein BCR39DRAFT_522298 [Naematelia encephala]|uniref:Magnesium transporter NIPA-domain-containing protein n=1 Tax=Naematelia encephala TaxID=71784 RepID=A0A1Y2BEB8_9TREE|nr:hypothetical protein BCR39DRAFT_522298 [Naematelia encephala]